MAHNLTRRSNFDQIFHSNNLGRENQEQEFIRSKSNQSSIKKPTNFYKKQFLNELQLHKASYYSKSFQQIESHNKRQSFQKIVQQQITILDFHELSINMIKTLEMKMLGNKLGQDYIKYLFQVLQKLLLRQTMLTKLHKLILQDEKQILSESKIIDKGQLQEPAIAEAIQLIRRQIQKQISTMD